MIVKIATNAMIDPIEIERITGESEDCEFKAIIPIFGS